jgi:hypothetical protein
MADNWTKKFWKPVKPKDGKPIETLVHARAYMLAMPMNFGTKPEWRRVNEAVMIAAKDASESSIHEARTCLIQALTIAGKLDHH